MEPTPKRQRGRPFTPGIARQAQRLACTARRAAEGIWREIAADELRLAGLAPKEAVEVANRLPQRLRIAIGLDMEEHRKRRMPAR